MAQTIDEEFEQEFWPLCPKKVGKLDAKKAYARARRLDTKEAICGGMDAYRQHLPEDSQFVCHPATFLNKGYWMNAYEVERPQKVNTNRYIPFRLRKEERA